MSAPSSSPPSSFAACGAPVSDRPGAGDAAPPAVQLRDLDVAHELPQALAIFREYVASPTVSLDYQGHAAEFADLAGHYAPPQGGLVLAWRGDEVLGCAALRRVDAQRGELKRVYVRPAARGLRLGERLVRAVIARATQAGYQRLCLDVLPEFQAAQRLYERLGFVDAEAVTFNPVPGTRFMALNLAEPPPG
ncbi:hypothetical protein CCO03_17275 [Comamonas serinivorans]|uniref:N-acetyltransferase domain-containing protein n=1 Tax=Comamonas serinivorans TaxID=1082851 RepID=A0A1Y0ES27_9BURK|nr:GNAT family N-acetyltransferase [Comamonas serinivorans]ARU06191.1 hypothetical protein CCO03_17275 [Comamonas serinivorans]